MRQMLADGFLGKLQVQLNGTGAKHAHAQNPLAWTTVISTLVYDEFQDRTVELVAYGLIPCVRLKLAFAVPGVASAVLFVMTFPVMFVVLGALPVV